VHALFLSSACIASLTFFGKDGLSRAWVARSLFFWEGWFELCMCCPLFFPDVEVTCTVKDVNSLHALKKLEWLIKRLFFVE